MYLTIHFIVKICHMIKVLLILKKSIIYPFNNDRAEKFIVIGGHKKC